LGLTHVRRGHLIEGGGRGEMGREGVEKSARGEYKTEPGGEREKPS